MNPTLSAMQAALAEALALESLPTQPVHMVSQPNMVAAAPRVPLQGPTRFSQSLLWDLQRRFFDQLGGQAWTDGIVPHYVTSNAVIAKVYARMIQAYIEDCVAAKLTGPVTIVELGTGSGQFSFHVLKALTDMRGAEVEGKPGFRYVMTDFTAQNLQFWVEHPAFLNWRAQGLVDFALFDAVKSMELVLHDAQVTISKTKQCGPMLVIANYLWDSIPQDYFKFSQGKLMECRVALDCTLPNPDPQDASILKHVVPAYSFVTSRNAYYKVTALDKLLDEYRKAYNSAVVPFPFSGIDCLIRLAAMSKGPLGMLSADKGFVNPEVLTQGVLPSITHHGSFSLSVNYDAFRRHFLATKGQFYSSGRDGNSITVVGGVLKTTSKQVFEQFGAAFAEHVTAYGPDDYFQLKKGLERNFGAFGADELLAYVRSTGYDPKAARRVMESLLPRLEEVEMGLREHFAPVLARAWENYYFLGEEFDLGYLFGRVLATFHDHDAAQVYLQASLRNYGDQIPCLVLLGACLYELGDVAGARDCLRRADALDGFDERSQHLRKLLAV